MGKDLDWVWVDTCCINKASSAELSEAINSMFQWYKASRICFVYLSDLDPGAYIGDGDPGSPLATCNWFTRGWTLQELIVSERVEFYDRDWNFRGTKESLEGQLSMITGIDIEVLQNSLLLPSIPIARRMSWATRRRTTRVEDTAY